MLIQESTANVWEDKYEAERSRLMTLMLSQTHPGMTNAYASQINLLESCNRIFLHFAETGDVSVSVI